MIGACSSTHHEQSATTTTTAPPQTTTTVPVTVPATTTTTLDATAPACSIHDLDVAIGEESDATAMGASEMVVRNHTGRNCNLPAQIGVRLLPRTSGPAIETSPTGPTPYLPGTLRPCGSAWTLIGYGHRGGVDGSHEGPNYSRAQVSLQPDGPWVVVRLAKDAHIYGGMATTDPFNFGENPQINTTSQPTLNPSVLLATCPAS